MIIPNELFHRNNKERRRWAAGGGNGSPRRFRLPFLCTQEGCIRKAITNNQQKCGKHFQKEAK